MHHIVPTQDTIPKATLQASYASFSRRGSEGESLRKKLNIKEVSFSQEREDSCQLKLLAKKKPMPAESGRDYLGDIHAAFFASVQSTAGSCITHG